jgi:hypothetical protein
LSAASGKERERWSNVKTVSTAKDLTYLTGAAALFFNHRNAPLIFNSIMAGEELMKKIEALRKTNS